MAGSSSEALRGAGSCNSQSRTGTAVSIFWLPARPPARPGGAAGACRVVKLQPLPSFLFFHHDQGSTSTMLLDGRDWEGRDCTKTPTLRTTVTFVSWLKGKGIMV